MKLLITFICALFMVACGGSSSSTTTTTPPAVAVEETGPPWERLEASETAMYANDYACVDATEIMTSMMDWEVIEWRMDELGDNRYIDAVMGPSGFVGLLLYREGEKNVVEMGMLMLSETDSLTFIDYNILRAFHTGAASPEDANAFSLATGEYFCVYM